MNFINRGLEAVKNKHIKKAIIVFFEKIELSIIVKQCLWQKPGWNVPINTHMKHERKKA